MRFKTSSLIVFFLLAAGRLGLNAHPPGAYASGYRSDDKPKISSVRVKGKKLILIGENFADGAIILINGEPHTTANDPDNPSTTLIAINAGNAIPNNSVVVLQVQNSDNLSDKFHFFRGHVVTADDVGRPIRLKVGDRFLLSLGNEGYQFTLAILDESVLKRVFDIPGSPGVFEALRTGRTRMTAVGELPCHKATPACLAPTLVLEFRIIIE